MLAYLQIALAFLKLYKPKTITQTHTINTPYGIITLSSKQPLAIENYLRDIYLVKSNIREVSAILDTVIINSNNK